ncbi:MAG: hypothetical protein ACRC7N_21680 [Clostridium sp.]
MKQEILRWDKAKNCEKEEIIYKIFNKISLENKLDLAIDSNMPVGYENANAMINTLENKIYFNIEKAKMDDSITPIYSLIHEIRHAIQYKYKSLFNSILVRSLDYVIMYDGNAYKIVENEWKHCKLDKDIGYCTEIYLLSPNEQDANKFAYEYLMKIVPEIKDDLDDILNFWMPRYEYIKKENIEAELEVIYNYIESHAK